ncbi:DsbA family protein [Marinomonas spartinae]|uniref:DsbA family protein n=1 Tax=Marinomonas spartinae TaxID=1792290 RepID=UPI0018F10B2B|nr:DsbA family protein [Marinomonas spartinae]MBJ7554376.1 DsbA family protein [Marinomonas spartinae]
MLKVHYFFDPMCGWCYAASSLVEVLANMQAFEILYHPGGMIPKRAIEPSFRQHILQADKRITEMTKVPFGDNYIARVKGPEEYVVDSLLPTQAMIAGEKMGIDRHTMLVALQKAHYQEGKHLHEPEVLAELALSLGLDKAEWEKTMTQSSHAMKSEITQSRQLMSQMQVSGFPTFILEKDVTWMPLSHSAFYGKPTEWKAYLSNLL